MFFNYQIYSYDTIFVSYNVMSIVNYYEYILYNTNFTYV